MNAPKKRPMPKDTTETRVGVFAFARGYRARVLPRGTRSPQKSWRYLASVRSRGRWATQKSGLPSLVSDKRKQGYGGNRTTKTKKGRALAGVTIEPGQRAYPCPLPSPYPCPCLCLCLSLSPLACSCLPGEIQGKGVGVSLVLFLKNRLRI